MPRVSPRSSHVVPLHSLRYGSTNGPTAATWAAADAARDIGRPSSMRGSAATSSRARVDFPEPASPTSSTTRPPCATALELLPDGPLDLVEHPIRGLLRAHNEGGR